MVACVGEGHEPVVAVEDGHLGRGEGLVEDAGDGGAVGVPVGVGVLLGCAHDLEGAIGGDADARVVDAAGASLHELTAREHLHGLVGPAALVAGLDGTHER